MAMQGIDISSWQAGIDLSRVPCDFVIVKATQGTWYVSESCDAQVQQAISLGKPFGFYHIEDNGKQAGATVDYKSLAAAYKRCNKDIANGLAMSLHALTVDGWVECGAC